MSLESIGSFEKSLFPGKSIFSERREDIVELAKKNIAITTDNLAISFNPSGKPNVTILGDYFKASKEIADLIGKLFLKDQAKALSLEEAFYSIKSKDETYLFKVADFLQKQYEAISPMRALFDDAWGKAEEQAVYKLANQLENVFSIYSAKGELKTFSEFADEIKALYKGLAFKAKEIAVQELKAINPKQAEEFERAFEKLENKRRNRGLFVGLGIMVTLLSAAIGGYFYMKHQEEQAKEPYKQAGLTDEQAEQFISKYHSQNGNSTWVSFAQAWVKDKALADKSFDAFKDLKSSLGYIYFVSSNGYDGLSFLKDFPQLKDNYQAILPAYSKNSSLVRIVFDQFQRDEKISDKKALFLEALKAYEELGREVQKFSQIYAINNATSYFGSSAKLKEEIGSEALLAALRKLGENDEINKDFDNTAKHAHLLRLAKHVQNILKYPKEWREGAIQIDDIGYKINPVSGIALATQNESKFWNIVEKAVKYTVDKLDSGEAAYYLDIPDAKLEAWYRRVRLLPRELFTIDIVSGDWRAPNLDFGEKNVSSDPRIGGKIPQYWLEEVAKKDFREKTLRYQLAMMKTRVITYPKEYWPRSYQAFMDALDIVLAEDPESVFIIGYSRAIGSGFLPWNLEPIVPVSEQATLHYAVL